MQASQTIHIRQDASERAHTDYRQSHLLKGDEYDSRLAADPFDAYMADWERDLLETLVPQLFPSGVPRYLDFACGTGRVSQTVASHSRVAVGVDISETMLVQARNRCPQMFFLRADLTREDPDLGHFDLITAFRFFGNAQDELRASALKAIHRLLRDDGHFVFNNHRNPFTALSMAERLTGGDPGMDLTHAKLQRLLHDAGFRIVSSRGMGAWRFHHRLTRPPMLRSRIGAALDRAVSGRLFVPLSLDAVIVARKR